ncbi:MAG: hypothetical protein KDD75_20650, partial [Caldilineaceae bacterium]|nr:hypothetical protein [Caldilineaceae bacterium]
WHGLGQLAAAGVDFAAERLWDDVAVGDDPRTRKTPKLAVNLSGVNYNKPYPPVNGKAAPNPARNGTHAPVSQTNAPHEKATGYNGRSTGVAPTAPAPTPATPTPAPAPRQAQPAAPALPPVTVAPNAAAPVAQPVVPAAPPMPAATPSPVPPAPQPIAAPAPAPVAPQGDGLAWVNALQRLQQQTADAHMAFLNVAEQSLRSLEAMMAGGARGEGRGASSATIVAQPAPVAFVQPPAPAAPVQPIVAPPPVSIPAAPVAPEPVAVQLSTVNGQRSTVNEAAPAAPAPSLTIDNSPLTIDRSSSPDLHATMLAVVTEKTGY